MNKPINLVNLKITHNPVAHQFFTDIEGHVAKLDYKISQPGKTLDYYYTFVPPEFRGQKIGEKVVQFAMDFAKTNHYKIIPSCPFVQRFIDQNPEYSELVYKNDF